MKVIGRKKVSFVAKEGDLKGQTIEGMNFFCLYPIDTNGDGYGVEKIFVSARKLANMDHVPELEDEISVYYNRFGKVDAIKVSF